MYHIIFASLPWGVLRDCLGRMRPVARCVAYTRGRNNRTFRTARLQPLMWTHDWINECKVSALRFDVEFRVSADTYTLSCGVIRV